MKWDYTYKAWYYFDKESGVVNFVFVCFCSDFDSKMSIIGVSTWDKPDELDEFEFIEPLRKEDETKRFVRYPIELTCLED